MSLTVVIPLYDKFDSLDVLGPCQAFYFAGMTVVLCAETLAPVTSLEGVQIIPGSTFEGCPQADVLFVPGGEGPMEVFSLGSPSDNPYLQFLVKQAAGVKLLCSVCTGAILLAGAGLLKNQLVTTHWAYKPVLRLFDCTVIDDYRRYVQSGTIVTGAGISSGLDEALYLIGVLLGVQTARSVQLKMQYHPQPVFHCGDPTDADIQDDPGMVAQVSTEWEIEQAYEQVAQWMGSASAK